MTPAAAAAEQVAPDPILAFRRNAPEEKTVCVFNMSAAPATWSDIPGGELISVSGEVLDGTLAPYASILIRI